MWRRLIHSDAISTGRARSCGACSSRAIDRVAGGNDAISAGGSDFMGDLSVTSNRPQTSRHVGYNTSSRDWRGRWAKRKTQKQTRPQLTSLFGRLVVCLAHQPAVLHQVVLVPRGQLPLAHDAGEAVQVVDEVLRPPHHLCGRDALLTRRALGAESPSVENKTVAV